MKFHKLIPFLLLLTACATKQESYMPVFEGVGVVPAESREGYVLKVDGMNVAFVYMFTSDTPDMFVDGKIRVVSDGKVGYANEKGKIIITPQFTDASQFSGKYAVATLSDLHKEASTDETASVQQNDNGVLWGVIDENGNWIKTASFVREWKNNDYIYHDLSTGEKFKLTDGKIVSIK